MMKLKNLCLIALAVAGLCSCSSSKKATIADMKGEWDIVSLNGEAVKAGVAEQPFIGFDTKEGRIYGRSGCNRILGQLDMTAAPGEISFAQMGSTRMACPNMDLENNVLQTLSGVTGYKKTGNDSFTFYNADKKAVAVVKKRCGVMKPSELAGEWLIISVEGVEAKSEMDIAPFMAFDLEESRVNGNAGCNLFNSAITLEEGQSIAFSLGASTMMSCPDMELEQLVLGALGKIRKYGRMSNGNLGLFDHSGNVCIELKKK